MSKGDLRVAAVNVAFASGAVTAPFDSDIALFDFDVVLVRPPQFPKPSGPSQMETYRRFERLMATKKAEIKTLFRQGGILAVLLDVPSVYEVEKRDHRGPVTYSVNNYDFIEGHLARHLIKGSGTQITFTSSNEPFVDVIKGSNLLWTAYLANRPDAPLSDMIFFASAGAGGFLAGKMAYGEGHIILLPNLVPTLGALNESSFLEACAEYRFKRQGTKPPVWVENITVPGLDSIETSITTLDKQIAEMNAQRTIEAERAESITAYRKLLYEKGKTQLEPIVLRALDNLEFGTTPSEMVSGIHEIDGRTTTGSSPGILEVKGSKNQILQSEFSPFITKIVADADVSQRFSKGILVGNGLCESEPKDRLGDSVFSKHVLGGAKRHSVALVNSVELFWLCCALLRGDQIERERVREAILAANGYVDLKPFCGASPF
jgi:hypothetical protein